MGIQSLGGYPLAFSDNKNSYSKYGNQLVLIESYNKSWLLQLVVYKVGKGSKFLTQYEEIILETFGNQLPKTETEIYCGIRELTILNCIFQKKGFEVATLKIIRSPGGRGGVLPVESVICTYR